MTAFCHYYHYTDVSSLNKILETGMIRKSLSKTGDAAFGEGVYLTRLDPMHEKKTILHNNYCNENGPLKKKADAVLRLKIRKSAVQKCSNDRNVFLYPGTLLFDKPDVKRVQAYHIKNTRDGREIKEVLTKLVKMEIFGISQIIVFKVWFVVEYNL